MWDVDFTGIGHALITLLAEAGLSADDEGKVVKITGEKTAGLCNAEDVFYGVLSKYDEGGGVVAVNRKGFETVAYSGDAPSPGRVALVADGLGGVKIPSGGVGASLVTGVEGDENAILWTAVAAGDGGHDIRVQLKDPGAANQSLAIDVVGKDVIVSLATGGDSAITSTAANIIAAVASSAAGSLVTAANSGDSDGTGVAAAAALTALAGGVNPVSGRVCDVLSVDAEGGVLTLDLG